MTVQAVPPQSASGEVPSAEAVQEWRRRIRVETFANYHYQMGIAIERHGDRAAAIAAFERALETHPDLAAASYRLKAAFEAGGLPNEADRVHRTALERNRTYVGDALVTIAGEMLDEGRAEEAAGTLLEAESLGTGLTDALAEGYCRAGAAAVDAAPDRALGLLQAAVRLDPASAESRWLLARCLTWLARTDEALRAGRVSVALAPEKAEPLVQLAKAEALSGRFASALTHLKWSLQLPAQNQEASNFEIALIETAAGRFSKAVQYGEYRLTKFQRNRLAWPSWCFAYAWLGKGLGLHHQGRVEDALHAYRQALSNEQGMVMAKTLSAVALSDLGRHDEAASLVRTAMTEEKDPLTPLHRMALGLILGRAGQAEEAMGCHRAVSANPAAPFTLRILPGAEAELGSVYAGLGMRTLAPAS